MTLSATLLLLASVTAATWNMRWFPSGRAEHRASPRMEEAAFADAADVIRAAICPNPPPPARGNRILFLQEMRDAATVSNLVVHIGDTGLVVSAASAFRERDGRLGWQQCAIVTDARTLTAGWRSFKSEKHIRPPRGFAYALLDCGADGLVACGCVHLKSNYGAGRDPEVRRINVTKRGAGAHQAVAFLRTLCAPDGRLPSKTLLAGDFNADKYAESFADERVFKGLARDGFVSCWDGASPRERITFPWRSGTGGSTIDYIFHTGFNAVVSRKTAPLADVSDHLLTVVRID